MGFDTFVTKLNAAGSALVYSARFGGSFDDFGRGIDLDDAGNAYITGWTVCRIRQICTYSHGERLPTEFCRGNQ